LTGESLGGDKTLLQGAADRKLSQVGTLLEAQGAERQRTRVCFIIAKSRTKKGIGGMQDAVRLRSSHYTSREEQLSKDGYQKEPGGEEDIQASHEEALFTILLLCHGMTMRGARKVM